MSEEGRKRLMELYEEISYVEQALSLLGWDQETYMPEGAVLDRAGQFSVLSAIYHRKITDPELGRLVSSLDQEDLGEEGDAIVREIGRMHRRQVRVPESLVKEIATTQSLAQHAWQEARKKDDFGMFRPHLEKMLDLKIQEAEHIGYDKVPYDALLDGFEPYARSEEVKEMFSSLRADLVAIVKRIAEEGKDRSDPLEGMMFPVPDQERFCRDLAGRIGFDFTRGRLDVSAHPFTSGTRRDVRMTTRFDERDLKGSVFSTVHEAGHALYEQGYLERNYLSPLAEAASLGVHESQSRFWENIVGRSRPFWSHMLPVLISYFPSLSDVSLDAFHRAVNIVRPSLIRTESDEVTYNLHILIRFEMETAMIEGKVSADEVPGLWNEKYEKYLGIVPPTDADGCLQDIHWSMGLFGYFPTYTLGNLYSAQIADAMGRDIPSFDDLLGAGNYGPILGWLRENIHQKGRLYPPKVLIEKATGSAPDAGHFISYLKKKFSSIYGISL